MEPEEYRLMFELEQGHWWYKGLHDLTVATAAAYVGEQEDIRILDAGCGTGFTLKLLSGYGDAYGIDISSAALNFCRRRGLINRISEASIMKMPFKNESFDVAVSNDVIYHKLVTDDSEALGEIRRVLKKGGIFILNLPAYNRLRRPHDERVHTRARYSKGEVAAKMAQAEFEVLKISYRNVFLLGAFILLRALKDNNSKSDLKPVNYLINRILYGLLRIENFMLRFVDFPFGASVFCVARK